MELKDIRSVINIKEIAKRASVDAALFNELFLSIKNEDERIAYNASWAAGHLLQKYTNYNLDNYLPILIVTASNTSKGGLKRNIFKIIHHVRIPIDYQYDCADLAMNSLLNPKEDIAVRAFALSILENLIPSIPELIDEVFFIIEKEKLFATPAFVVRSIRYEKAAAKYLKNRS
jgi:hypothetical protein